MKNKLLSNTIYFYIFTITKMAFPLLTLPYIMRVLSIEIYGYVAYVKSYMSYVQLVLDFGFLLSATKNIAVAKGKDNAKIEYIIGDTIAEKGILLLVAAGITFAVSILIPMLTARQVFLWLYFGAIGTTIFIPDFLYRGIERMECIAIPYAIAKILAVVLTFILIKSDRDLMLIPVIEIVSNVILVLISFALFKRLNINIKFGNIRTWFYDLKESTVYFVSNFATTIFGALMTIIVGILLDESDVAYWSVCMQIVSAAKSLYVPICNSIYPYMVMNCDLGLVMKIANFMIVPMIMGSAVVMFFGEQIMIVIGGENYKCTGYILKLLLPVIVVSFYSMLYGWPVLGAIGKVRQTTISTVIAAIIQVAGIIIIYYLKLFNLVSLALCCGVSETILLLIRLGIFIKSKKSILNNVKKEGIV